MNELFDKLLLRIVISTTLCLTIIFYKYAHAIFYPSSRSQLFHKFFPNRNSADTLHFFGRIIGIGVIFSGLYFNMQDGLYFSLLGFFIQGCLGLVLYLISIYILESITLYNFIYNDEVIKRKNICYGIITFFQSITLSFILRTVIQNSNYSLINLIFLWLFSLVLYGLSTKFYKFISDLPFEKLINSKNMALAFSYSGFLTGATTILVTSLAQDIHSIENYILQVMQKIILSIIIFPVFHKGLIIIFKIKNEFDFKKSLGTQDNQQEGPPVGHGIFEGTLFFTSCLLTTIITGHINFGNYYPEF